MPTLQVRPILQATTIRDRQEALTTLPLNLGDAFAGTMTRIEQQPNALFAKARKIIVWIHLAERPLTVNELLCLLAVRDGDTALCERRIPIRKTLLNSCHGLAVIDQETSTVRLVHYSLHEHLCKQEQIFGLTKARWHSKIARTCLTFLNFSSTIAEDIPEQNSNAVTLLPYAATQWGHHLRKSEQSPDAPIELGKEYILTTFKKNLKSFRLLYKEMYPLQREHELPHASPYNSFLWCSRNHGFSDINSRRCGLRGLP